MADGRQFVLPLADELIVDLFAGGGGMSVAIERAYGRHADIAVNHSDDALSMHRANHPQTRHFIADVFEVDPRGATRGRPVGHLHLSPDCTHFSQAKGGQPRNAKIRGLSWVAIRWAGQVRPRRISLENVKQLRHWGPLVAKRDPATGRVVTLEEIVDPKTGKKSNRVAGPGEQVPISNQFLVPDPKHAGRTWSRFLSILRGMGYAVEHKLLVAADFGAPTTRERLFLFARCDGEPIVWPEPTHFKAPKRGQKKWRAAAECIDWSIPCPSIFERKRPLADATLRRIARGLKRYVIDAAEPFIVPIANWSRDASQPASAPLSTVTAWPRGGQHAVVAPTVIQVAHGEGSGKTKRRGSGAHDPEMPLGTVPAGGNSFGAVAAFLAQQNTMPNGGVHAGHDAREPMSTITNTGSHQNVVAASLATLRGTNVGRGADEPMRTASAGGEHHALVEYTLSREQQAGALRVAALLINYYGNGQPLDLRDPADTVTTKDRLALVTVWLKGSPYVIVDVGLRMLKPRELYRAQGFPDGYLIERGHDGRVFTGTEQVRMVGNSVSPPPAEALLRANITSDTELRRAA
jgi:DNA (cytosine-5)-methyltransferase 1